MPGKGVNGAWRARIGLAFLSLQIRSFVCGSFPLVTIAGNGSPTGAAAVQSILANATVALSPRYGNLSFTYDATDSPQGIANLLQGADDWASSFISLTAAQYAAAAPRVILQIPWAVATMGIIFNLPGITTGQLRLDAPTLARIFQCQITNWTDPAIAQLNPNLQLPPLKIVPAALSEATGTTQLLASYLKAAPGWRLGVSPVLAWPHCVQHIRGAPQMVQAVAETPGAISYAEAWITNGTVPTALVKNLAGSWVGPSSKVSTLALNLPNTLASPAWANVSFPNSDEADNYPLCGILYAMTYQDLTAAGMPDAAVIRDLMLYFLSDPVQSNLSYFHLTPLPHLRVLAQQQEVAAIVVSSNDSSLAAAPVGSGLVSSGTVVEGSGGASIASLITAVLANATVANAVGSASLTFTPVDSQQGKQGVLSGTYAYGMSTFPLTAADLASESNLLVQVPVGFSPIAFITSVPGLADGQLMLTPVVLAAIFQCDVTRWNDPAIQTLNPGLQLPSVPIVPVGLADVSGSTSLFASYLARAPGWALGTGASLAWGRCVKRTIGGSAAVVSMMAATPYAISYSTTAAYTTAHAPNITAAAVQNRAGAFVVPAQSAFPFTPEEMPPSIASRDWNKLDLNMSVRADKYPCGGLIFMIANADLSTLGYPESGVVQQLMQYFLSDVVQSNLSAYGASPMPPAYLASERQQVAGLKVVPSPGQSPGGAAGAAGSAAAAGQAPAPAPLHAAGAGLSWWVALIIALMAAALLALAGAMGFILLRRRRKRRRNAALPLQGVLTDGKDGRKWGTAGGVATVGVPGGGAGGANGKGPPGGAPGGPLPVLADDGGPGGGMDQVLLDGTKSPSVDSDHLMQGGERRTGGSGSASASGAPEGAEHADASGGDISPATARRLGSGLCTDSAKSHTVVETRAGSPHRDMSDGRLSVGQTSSRAQSLNKEPNNSSLPDVLRARAEGMDIDEIELGPLIGRGSFGRVYQGWWRGGSVAIKVVAHEGDLDGKVGALRESLLCSSIQHPHVVTTYKVISSRKGTVQKMAPPNQASIPEGEQVSHPLSNTDHYGSGKSEASSAAGSSGTSRDGLMETCIIMEYCDLGSLDTAIGDGRFTNLEAMLMRLLDVAMGMDYLHRLGILHTDLKPSNVLLKTSPKSPNDPMGCTCKLADFGLSRVLETNATHISTNTIGTIAYQPEEVLKEGHVTPASDVYSFAILMYEMFTRKHLFKGLLQSQMFFKVFNGYRPPMPVGMPRGLQALLTACWAHDPAERPSFASIVTRLQRLVREERRRMGRAISVNLDDALPPFEPAAMYPVAPAMPLPHKPFTPPLTPGAGTPYTGSAPGSASNGLFPAGREGGSRANGSDTSRPPLDYFGRGDALSRAASEGLPPQPDASPKDDFAAAIADVRAKAAAGQLSLSGTPSIAEGAEAAEQPEARPSAAAEQQQHPQQGVGTQEGTQMHSPFQMSTPFALAAMRQPQPISRKANRYDQLLGD